jgi:hypothetical protein
VRTDADEFEQVSSSQPYKRHELHHQSPISQAERAVTHIVLIC